MPGTGGSTKPRLCYVFSNTHIPVMKFNLEIKHSERLTRITNDKIEQFYHHIRSQKLHEHEKNKLKTNYVNVNSPSLTVPYCPVLILLLVMMSVDIKPTW